MHIDMQTCLMLFKSRMIKPIDLLTSSANTSSFKFLYFWMSASNSSGDLCALSYRLQIFWLHAVSLEILCRMMLVQRFWAESTRWLTKQRQRQVDVLFINVLHMTNVCQWGPLSMNSKTGNQGTMMAGRRICWKIYADHQRCEYNVRGKIVNAIHMTVVHLLPHKSVLVLIPQHVVLLLPCQQQRLHLVQDHRCRAVQDI